MINVFYAIILYIIGILVTYFFSKKYKINLLHGQLIYNYHTIFTIIRFLLIIYGVLNDDATDYFENAQVERFSFGIGTDSITSFTHFLIQYLKFNFFSCFMLFNIFGTFSSLGLYILANYIFKSKKNALLFGLVPGLNFFTSVLGKDPIIVSCITILTLYYLLKKYNFFNTFFVLTIIFLVRPQIGLLILGSYFIFVLVSSKISLYLKIIFLSFLFFITITYLKDLVFKYIEFNYNDLSSYSDYIEKRQDLNQGSNSSIDISNYNLFYKLYTYLFRPMPWESFSFSSFIISFENLIYLFLFLFMLIKFKLKIIFRVLKLHMAIFIYVIAGLFIFSSTTSNLGIIVRQKWMFIPVIFLLVSEYITENNKLKKYVQ